MSTVSFWRQNLSWSASQTSANDRFFSGVSFFGGASGNQTDLAINTAASAMTSISSAATNYYLDAAILAAKQGTARIDAANAAKNAATPKLAGDLGNQITFSGSLTGVVDFGADGPSASGGFQFTSGTALTDAFNLAMLAEKSNGSAIDTVSVTGNTLTASTSGDDAHPVFSVTLQPNSGLYSFKLLNPIDGVATGTDKFVTSFNLSGLMQGVKSTGTTITLPNNITVSIYGDQDYASGTTTAGAVHQGGLPYTPPATVVTPVTVTPRTPYQPPVNPLTGYAFVTTSSISASNSSVNVRA
jgi:hypothetical protein